MILYQYLTAHQTLGYAIIFLGIMIEGDIILFTAGFLTFQGFFNLGIMLPLVFLGTMIGDNLWYVFGELIGEKKIFFKFKNFIEKATGPFDDHLKNRPIRTIFISKFTYGLGKTIILKAGSMRVSFEKFIKADFIATSAWIFVVGGLGYLSSVSFLAVRRYLRYTEIALLLGVIIFVIISFFFSKIFKKEL